jgi:hypothetical protein
VVEQRLSHILWLSVVAAKSGIETLVCCNVGIGMSLKQVVSVLCWRCDKSDK